MSYVKDIVSVVRDAQRWARSPQPRIPTGYSIIDSRTDGGAANGEVILFQCRSQVGKTLFACNVIENNAGRPCVLFSLEMTGRYIALRLAAIHSGIDSKVLTDQIKAGDNSALEALVEAHPNLIIIDKPGMTLKEMSLAITESEQALGAKVELTCIDYMELIGGVPSMGGVDQVDKVARKIKDMTREHDLVTLLLHQVGRGEGGAGHEPLSLTAGRYGGETQADYVLGAYRPCLRPGINQQEYLTERFWFYIQFLKTRGGSEIHPEGALHLLDPFTMKLHDGYPPQPLFSEREDDDEPPF